ncbi:MULTISPECIES: ATP-binding protein [Streptomycetaceae]|uniref:Histidine kinase/HSP90-like ATPase domain-containing protein n=1 Tax=Streptantibioticus cattleyicolor (strain ATCC 35852 / DSM 46488 / JCM 4925 / NBRC 14057 / NRRL 8057) TaxID=1003195 RepID=F8JXF7_STREN|nr:MULTISPECIES: ATP-binding protein [Streptomycetaceae]AEW95837.1 hypothetical protein SCATT_34660 [Streptantibioticus cattleyicolor NRRL 8057 = DSM 46488]MYS60380.1 ATP-binding protein [Streptomyces sp. SID5468]CCB76176.1 Regulatory protein [Streptantibioticus cattleyicolor NRRL 8057 = DSM 46488]
MPATEFSLVFPPDPAWVRAARHAVTTMLTTARREELADTAALLTSEAVTNAVNACRASGCGTPITLFGEWVDRRLRVLVHDEARGMPQARTPGPEAESGRGLALIHGCATEWGVCRYGAGRGKTVWFEYAAG